MIRTNIHLHIFDFSKLIRISQNYQTLNLWGSGQFWQKMLKYYCYCRYDSMVLDLHLDTFTREKLQKYDSTNEKNSKS